MSQIRTVIDENIPYGKEVFSALGSVKIIPGRSLSPKDIENADVLCVRSVTQVNEELLIGSSVRFVATATIGLDHIDQKYLQNQGIGFASAPGSNANSVAEYIIAALLEITQKSNQTVSGKTLGIIGVGHVGTAVSNKAKHLGLRILWNDPPRQAKEGDSQFCELEKLLNESDFVSIHVPLKKSGKFPTYHLADKQFFQEMKQGAVFLNTARGAVHETQALCAALDSNLGGVVLDVWENEPNINEELANAVFLGTPHIAGYSFDGKVNGTRMIFDAACKYLGIDSNWPDSIKLPMNNSQIIKMDQVGETGDAHEIERALHKAVSHAFPIQNIDIELREVLQLSDRGKGFDALRKNHPIRREFQNYSIQMSKLNQQLGDLCRNLGFQILKM